MDRHDCGRASQELESRNRGRSQASSQVSYLFFCVTHFSEHAEEMLRTNVPARRQKVADDEEGEEQKKKRPRTACAHAGKSSSIFSVRPLQATLRVIDAALLNLQDTANTVMIHQLALCNFIQEKTSIVSIAHRREVTSRPTRTPVAASRVQFVKYKVSLPHDIQHLILPCWKR